jgi:hypothetical protein
MYGLLLMMAGKSRGASDSAVRATRNNHMRSQNGQCLRMYWPEWIPIRILSCASGLCLIVKEFTAQRIARAMSAISRAWSSPFLWGSPDTTIYASPIVSTCNDWLEVSCFSKLKNKQDLKVCDDGTLAQILCFWTLVRKEGLALSIGLNRVGFTWSRRQNPVSKTLYFEK